jgi:hypothetical protein
VLLTPPQVHAQQHLRPILGFGSARAGLNFHERVRGIHLALKHAPELKRLQALLQSVEVGIHVVESRYITLGSRQLREFAKVTEAAVEGCEYADDLFQRETLLIERLSPGLIVPDVRIGQGQFYFRQAVFFVGEVKDTPSAQRLARSDL